MILLRIMLEDGNVTGNRRMAHRFGSSRFYRAQAQTLWAQIQRLHYRALRGQ